MWPYCAKYVAYVHNRLDKRVDVLSAFEGLYKRTPRVKHFRKFGVLCYPRIHTQVSKLEDKYERGIFLGYGHVNSAYLVGVW